MSTVETLPSALPSVDTEKDTATDIHGDVIHTEAPEVPPADSGIRLKAAVDKAGEAELFRNKKALALGKFVLEGESIVSDMRSLLAAHGNIMSEVGALLGELQTLDGRIGKFKVAICETIREQAICQEVVGKLRAELAKVQGQEAKLSIFIRQQKHTNALDIEALQGDISVEDRNRIINLNGVEGSSGFVEQPPTVDRPSEEVAWDMHLKNQEIVKLQSQQKELEVALGDRQKEYDDIYAAFEVKMQEIKNLQTGISDCKIPNLTQLAKVVSLFDEGYRVESA